MKNNKIRRSCLLAALAVALSSQLPAARAQGTAFTYQGRLNSGTNAASGNYDLTFELFNASSGGSQVGATVTTLDVGVTNGLFTVIADFGAVYNGASYWLQIGVRTNGGGAYTALTPRQELTPVPYSVTAENVTGEVALAQLPSTVVTNNDANVTLGNVTVGGDFNLPLPAVVYAGANTILIAPENNNFYAGPSAGVSNGLGGANTGIGAGSLNSNTNGTNNTALGYQSLNNNTFGSYNVAIGERALFQNTNANDNTAVGRHAMQNNLNGADNTANGYQALLNNNGSYNTAEGSSALSGLTGGSYNIALGYLAGNNYGLSESSNILIGSLGVGGDNNTIRIGSAQTQTYIAGVINGDGSGLTNIPGASLVTDPGSANFFAGQSAGNAAVTGAHNTGVGNASLDVISSGDYNTAEGDSSLALNTTGGNNTAVGFKALWQNTNGGANTAVGSDALAFNVSGSDNTATGLGALEDNTASDNTAFGAVALNNNGSGFQNTAVGYYALNATTSGNYNTGVGASALGNNNGAYNAALGAGALGGAFATSIGGSYNAAMGADALAFNSTGSNNTATGFAALGENTTGNNNTANGYYSMGGAFSSSGGNSALGGMTLYGITTGYNNTAAGYSALEDNSTGADNVGIGVSTLQINESGFGNTAVGTYAFQNMTAGQGNVGLGMYAGYNLDAGTNNIYIGNEGLENDNNVIRIGSGQSFTFIDGAQVGINNHSPSAALDVSGEYMVIEGLTPVRCYIGDDGVANDVQVGSLKSGVTHVTFWNAADQANMQITCCAINIAGGCDLAEPFPVSTPEPQVSEGCVMVIDEKNPGKLKLASRPYDTKVAGVLSGANGIHPGIQMHQEGLMEGGMDVALTGRVYVQADASNGAIEPGDLLTTSSAPGRAMKVTDHLRAQGAILGKAMTGLSEGNGMVLVLVTLQ